MNVLARNSDHLSGGFDTDNTGGVLSGLLAEEDDLDRRALWRIGSWGVGAVAAVVVAVMANQSSLGLKREQMAAADLARQAQQIQLAARETQNETRRLASAVDTLNGDRDRLYSRVTSLEQGLDSATGAFIRQVSPTAVTPPVPTTEPQVSSNQVSPNPGLAPVVAPVTTTPTGPEKPVAKTTVPEPSLPAISSVAKDAPKTDAAKADAAKGSAKEAAKETAREIAKADKIEAAKIDAAKVDSTKPDVAKTEPAKTEAAKADPAKTDLAKTDPVKADPIKTEPAKPELAKTDLPKIDVLKVDVAKTEAAKTDGANTPAATPLVAAKSFMAPPDPAAGKLIEPGKPPSAVVTAPIPEVVATAPAIDEEADEAAAPKVALQRTEFGVDLGSANSLSGLRALWRGLLKSRSNAQLTALRPIIVIKEGTNGLGMQLRLVAGPLNDAGAAAKICAVMTENDRKCETTIFDGQRLTLKSEDVPQPAPASRPTSSRRHGGSRRAAAVVDEPAPRKPETTSSISTSLSSMFGRKNSQQ